jgi:hypothetical protein
VTGRCRATLDEAIVVLGPKSSRIVADVSKLAEMEAMFKGSDSIAYEDRLIARTYLGRGPDVAVFLASDAPSFNRRRGALCGRR